MHSPFLVITTSPTNLMSNVYRVIVIQRKIFGYVFSCSISRVSRYPQYSLGFYSLEIWCSVVQGKPLSKQVLEAVNYVGHLQRKIEDISAQREKMKVNSDRNANVSFNKFCNRTPLYGGSNRERPVEKETMWVRVFRSRRTLWKMRLYILLALEEGGLEVVSAASSASSNRLYHTVNAKVTSYNRFQC